MKNLSLIIMMVLSAGLLAACDEHEPVDLDIHPGYILCSDGQIVSPSAFLTSVRVFVSAVP